MHYPLNKEKCFLKTAPSVLSQRQNDNWPWAGTMRYLGKQNHYISGSLLWLNFSTPSPKPTESRDETELGKLVCLNEGVCCRNASSVRPAGFGPCCRRSLWGSSSVAAVTAVPISHPLREQQKNHGQLPTPGLSFFPAESTSPSGDMGGIEQTALNTPHPCLSTQDTLQRLLTSEDPIQGRARAAGYFQLIFLLVNGTRIALKPDSVR